jgi:hypothetical protein
MFDELYKKCCVMYAEETAIVTIAARLLIEAKTPEEIEKSKKLYQNIVDRTVQQVTSATKKRIDAEVKQSMSIGVAPRTEVLEGGFIYEYPYESNGSYFKPANTLQRLAQITDNAKTPEERASAKILASQVFEREMNIMKEQISRINKKIEDDAYHRES